LSTQPEPVRVLVIEDEEAVVAIITQQLHASREDNFEVTAVGTLEAGLQRLWQDGYGAVVLDLGLPDSEGIRTVARVRGQAPDVPIVVISGQDNQSIILEAMQHGVQEYLTKGPITNKLLTRAVRYAISRKEAENSLREGEQRFRELADLLPAIVCESDTDGNLTFASRRAFDTFGYTKDNLETGLSTLDMIASEDRPAAEEKFAKVLTGQTVLDAEFHAQRKDGSTFPILTYASPVEKDNAIVRMRCVAVDISERKKMEEELRETLDKLRQSMDKTVNVLALALEARDPYTAGHQQRVAALASAIAGDLGLAKNRIEGIRVAGILHDVGKISIPSEILSKPTRLSEAEFSLVRMHCQTGFDILNEIDFPWPVARIVLEHHERLDGSGYPRGLRGDEVLQESRILGVADVVEAMSSHRPYRSALGLPAALEEISDHRGVTYDPKVVDACVTLFNCNCFQFQPPASGLGPPPAAE